MIQMCVAHWRYSERQRTGPLCSLLLPLYQVDFFFFFNFVLLYGIYALPFAFVDLWKHTEEMNPNVAHPKTGLHSLFIFFIFRETWSALTSRSPTPNSVHPRLRKRYAQLCQCATGPMQHEVSRETVVKKDCRNVTAIGRVCARVCVCVSVRKGGRRGWSNRRVPE